MEPPLPDSPFPTNPDSPAPMECLEFAVDVRAERADLVLALGALEDALRVENRTHTADAVALLRSEAQNAPAVDDGLRCVFTAPEKPGVGLHPDGLTAEQLAKLTNTVRGYAEHSSGGRATRVQISVLMVGAVRQDIPERVFHAPPEPPSGGAEDMATTMPPDAP